MTLKKTTLQSIVLLFSFLIISVSASAQKIEGRYHSIDGLCKILLNIDKKNRYFFQVNKTKKSGIVKMERREGRVYLDFGEISSMYEKDTLTIQNSGNIYNQYHHFKECDEKFIQFVKDTKQN